MAVDPNSSIGPGVYEVYGTVTKGDASRLSLADFQKNITAKYGEDVRVLTYEVKGTKARIFIKVNEPRTATANNQGEVKAAFLLPLVITLVGVIATGFLIWAIAIQVTEGYKVVDQVIDSPGAQVAVGGFGIGAAALGVAALLYVLGMKGSGENGET